MEERITDTFPYTETNSRITVLPARSLSGRRRQVWQTDWKPRWYCETDWARVRTVQNNRESEIL